MFIIEKDDAFLNGCGFLKNHITCLYDQFEKIK